ncbi:MAG: radical SAM family heme chaperone HemW [Anaerolineaceae bacterium]
MLSVYIHIPFCIQRCSYCDFITYAGRQDLIPQYADAVIAEIRSLGAAHRDEKDTVETVYFGGGTPSLFTPAQVAACLDAIRSGFNLDQDAEITLEANPGTIQPGFFREIRMAGINRLSLGVQSFVPEELNILGRIHTVEDAYTSIEAARSAGFGNLNLDLIFGIPGQTLEGWENNLAQAVKLSPEHLSLYSLTLEQGTPLAMRVQQELIELPDDDLAADMFELAMEYLRSQGYDHYEISNWAASEARESRHNKTYWKNWPYLGIGAGAHGCAGGYRTENVGDIPTYIGRIQDQNNCRPYPFTNANINHIQLDEITSAQETMLLGLRLVREGVSCSAFQERYQQELKGVFDQEINRLFKKQLVEWVPFPDGEHLRLTHRGIMLGNQAFMEFV